MNRVDCFNADGYAARFVGSPAGCNAWELNFTQCRVVDTFRYGRRHFCHTCADALVARGEDDTLTSGITFTPTAVAVSECPVCGEDRAPQDLDWRVFEHTERGVVGAYVCADRRCYRPRPVPGTPIVLCSVDGGGQTSSRILRHLRVVNGGRS